MEGNFEASLWRHRWRHHHENTFFGIIWDGLFISKVKWKQCLIFQNGCHFQVATNFLPDVIPEVEYSSKIAMSISDILSFWSTLYLKYWDISISKFDVLCDLVMNTRLYKCDHNLLIPMPREFNGDIFARVSVIMKDVVIQFIKEYRGPILGHPVTSSVTSSSWKIRFVA